MKGILHSKKFKSNLNKWLISYFIVIGLFATVVTYSKYISSMNSTDRARAAIFGAEMTYVNSCSNNNEFTRCTLDDVRPTEPIDIYFKVDTTKMEVNSLFVTTILLNKYKFLKLYDGDQLLTTNDYTINGNVISITENLLTTNTYQKTYHLVVRYDYEGLEDDFTKSITESNAIKIGWSAMQID